MRAMLQVRQLACTERRWSSAMAEADRSSQEGGKVELTIGR